MPQNLSVKKRIRQNKVRNLRNRSLRSNLRTATKKVDTAIMNNKFEQAQSGLNDVIPIIDRAVSKGIIHKNNAARKKSRLMRKANTLAPPSVPETSEASEASEG